MPIFLIFTKNKAWKQWIRQNQDFYFTAGKYYVKVYVSG